MVRKYIDDDYNKINVLGRDISLDYMFDKSDNCFVYEDNGNIIGFVSYKILLDRAEIIDIFVHINNRRNGIGTELLKAMLHECKNSNCKSITMEVNVNNVPAIELYIKNGFKIISIRKKYYENNTIDANLMYKEL